MGNRAMKYIPVIISWFTVFLLLLAWAPLASLLFVFLGPILGMSLLFAWVLSGVLIMLPTLFLIGLNTNKKLFSVVMVGIALLLVLAFFLL